jgi:hypothetical protein
LINNRPRDPSTKLSSRVFSLVCPAERINDKARGIKLALSRVKTTIFQRVPAAPIAVGQITAHN